MMRWARGEDFLVVAVWTLEPRSPAVAVGSVGAYLRAFSNP